MAGHTEVRQSTTQALHVLTLLRVRGEHETQATGHLAGAQAADLNVAAAAGRALLQRQAQRRAQRRALLRRRLLVALQQPPKGRRRQLVPHQHQRVARRRVAQQVLEARPRPLCVTCHTRVIIRGKRRQHLLVHSMRARGQQESPHDTATLGKSPSNTLKLLFVASDGMRQCSAQVVNKGHEVIAHACI
jgi:hypothetical protein